MDANMNDADIPGQYDLEDSEDDDDDEDIIVQAVVAGAIALASLAIDHTRKHYDKIPYHDSALTGAAWVCELLTGHPKRIRRELGVHKHVF